MLINLARLSVLPQQPPEHPLPPHPQHLCRHPRLRSTLPLTGTRMPALSLRSKELPGPCTRVHSGRLDDNLAFLDELFNVRARVGVADFALLGGVEPDFAFADACDGGGEPFLGAKVDLQDVKYSDKESLDGHTHVFFPGLLAKSQTTVGFAIKTGYAP